MAEKLTEKDYGENLAANRDVRERVSSYVLQQIKAIQNGRAHTDAKHLILERLWRGEPISRFYPGSRSTHVPEPYKAVEALVPRIIGGILVNDDWFRVERMEEGRGDPRVIGMLLKQQLQDGDFRSQFEMLVRMCMIHGTAFAKMPFVWDTKTLHYKERERKPEYKNGIQIDWKYGKPEEKTFEINRDRTELRVLEIYDFLCDPRYEDPQEAPGCGDRTRQSLEYCLDMLERGIYGNITREQLIELGQSGKRPPTGLGESMRYTANEHSGIKRNPEDDLLVTEWWGTVPLDSDGTRIECSVTHINESICVRIQKHRLWHRSRPYLTMKYTPIQGELYGMGVIEPIVRLCQDLNDLRNTANHAAALCANPMIKAEDSAGIEDEQLVPVPGWVLRTERNEGVVPLYIPNLAQMADIGEARTKNDIVEVTGTTRLYYGAESDGGTTATEVYTRTREANVRVKRFIEKAGQSIERFLSVCHTNNHQFLEENRVVVLSGDANSYVSLKVTPDKLEGPARFRVLLAPQIELLGIRGQQMLGFLNQVMAQPMFFPNVEWHQMLKTIWEDMFGYRESEYIFPDVGREEVSQEDENNLMFDEIEIQARRHHNHAEHARQLEVLFMSPEFEDLKPGVRALMIAHHRNHQLWMKRLDEQASNPMMQQAGAEGPGGSMPALPGETGMRGMARQLSEQTRAGAQG